MVLTSAAPAFATGSIGNTEISAPDADEVLVCIPADAVPEIENGEVVYYNFVDPVTGYHYDFYNETTQAFFRWKENFVEPVPASSGDVSLLEDSAQKVVYWSYEFNRISYPIDGKSNGKTFVINGPAASISGDSHVYDYYYGVNDYDDTNATYKVQVKKVGVVDTTAFERMCNSNTPFYGNFTPNQGSTYYVVITPWNLGANQKISGSGEIYSYR